MTIGGPCGCWRQRWENGRTGGHIWMGRGAGPAREGGRRESPTGVEADCFATVIRETLSDGPQWKAHLPLAG